MEGPAAVAGGTHLAAAALAAAGLRRVGKLGQAPPLSVPRCVGLGVREKEEGGAESYQEEEEGGMEKEEGSLV